MRAPRRRRFAISLVIAATASVLVVLSAFASSQGATAPSATAGVSIDSIKKAGVLRVGTWLQYKPEMWKDPKSGAIKGFWVDMAREMGKELGVRVQFVDSDWDGLIPGLQADKFDIILAQMAITAPRALAVDFGKPWEAVGIAAVLPAKNPCRTIQCLNQPGKTIATEVGSANQTVKKMLFPRAKEVANKQHNDGFLQVRSGRADAFLTDNISALSYLKEHPRSVTIGWDGVKQPFLRNFPAGPAYQKGSLDLVRWVDIWLQDKINDGTYRRLYVKNIGAAPALAELSIQRGWYP
jgi:polar amino acid transport system substrate-binding protein